MSPKVPFDEPTEKELHGASELSRRHRASVTDNVELAAFGPRRCPFFREIDPWGSYDGSGNRDHLNLIFPVYSKLMTGFPSVHPEDVRAELLH